MRTHNRKKTHPTWSFWHLSRTLLFMAALACVLTVAGTLSGCGTNPGPEMNTRAVVEKHSADIYGAFGPPGAMLPRRDLVGPVHETLDSWHPYPIYRPGPGPWENYPGPWNPYHVIWVSYFNASRQLVEAGQDIQLSWNVPGARQVMLHWDTGTLDFFGASGIFVVRPQRSTTYQLNAFGFGGEQVSATVYVEVQPPPPQILALNVSPLKVNQGERATITWQAVHCQTVLLVVEGSSNGGGAYGCNGAIEVHPQSESRFRIDAFGPDGQQVSSPTLTIQVARAPEEIRLVSFTATPLTVRQGQEVSLEWRATGTSPVHIAGLSPPEQPSVGKVRLAPEKTTTFVLRPLPLPGRPPQPYGSLGQVTVTVLPNTPLPRVERLEAYPPSVETGKSITLSWKVSACTEFYVEGLELNSSGFGPIPRKFLPCEGSFSFTPTQSASLYFVARNGAGEPSIQSIYIPVVPPASKPGPAIWKFQASRLELRPGEPLTLSWETTRATLIEVRGPSFTAQGEARGQIQIYPDESGVYELVAVDAAGLKANSKLKVDLVPRAKPSIDFFVADAPISIGGAPIQISWRTRNCLTTEVPGVMPEQRTSEGSVAYVPRKNIETLNLVCKSAQGLKAEAQLKVGALASGFSTEDATNILIGLMGGEKPR